jgi:anaerobic selenocysteine-containing dehydrogenase
MAKSDCVVIWGTNAVSTQVNVMTHAIRARKERGAKIVVIDIYDTPTMKQADIKVLLKPGTDGAFACAVMHVLFREGLADRDYLHKFSDDPAGLESHLQGPDAGMGGSYLRRAGGRDRGLCAAGRHHESELSSGSATVSPGSATARSTCMRRCRSRSVTGSYQYEGGGAFHSNSDIFRLDKSLLEGRRHFDPGLRWLDQSKIGRILTGDAEALGGGPPVTAMLVQNTNPANVAPEQRKVIEGLKREDLFLAVHEQFMTDTARLRRCGAARHHVPRA